MIATLDSGRTYLDTYNTTTEKLPVVELRPFTTKQWLPSKSRPPQGYVAPTRAHTSLGISSTTAARGMTPRSTTNGPCPRAFSVTGERMNKHPPLRDTKNDAWKADVPVTAFVSKPARLKTTLEEIHSGQNMNSKYSCMKRSLTEVNISQQQDIRVKGKRMEKLPPKLSNLYCEPWELYASNSAPTKQMMEETLIMRIESLENTYIQLDENIYDPFDRARTLPCIVKPAQMAEKLESPRVALPPTPALDSREVSRPVVNNSLDLMSHTGRPLGVEHQLTSDLKQNLQHFRRTKDNVMLGHFVGSKGLPSRIDTGHLTPGQVNLRSSFNKNTAKRNTSKSKSSSTSESLSVTSSQRPAFSSLKQSGSDSILNGGSWCQGDSIPVPSAVMRSMTQVEFNEAHKVVEESQQLPVMQQADNHENKMDDNKMELESVHGGATTPLTSTSQDVLTIPTDEPNSEQTQNGRQGKSTTFITEKEPAEEAAKSSKVSQDDNTNKTTQ